MVEGVTYDGEKQTNKGLYEFKNAGIATIAVLGKPRDRNQAINSIAEI